MYLREEIPANRNLLRHGYYLLRTGLYAQFATFAVILVYRYAGHLNTFDFMPVSLRPPRLSPTASAEADEEEAPEYSSQSGQSHPPILPRHSGKPPAGRSGR
jgi:hypothetical protein